MYTWTWWSIYITCFEMINNSHLTQKLSFSNDKLFNITSYCVDKSITKKMLGI